MSTASVLLEAEMAVATVKEDAVILAIGFVLLVGVMVLWWVYVFDRWSWIPRKRHDRKFTERF